MWVDGQNILNQLHHYYIIRYFGEASGVRHNNYCHKTHSLVFNWGKPHSNVEMVQWSMHEELW